LEPSVSDSWWEVMIRRNVWSEVDMMGECCVLEGGDVVFIGMMALSGCLREREIGRVNARNTIAYS
jgi:hypothetical protein